MKKTETGQKTTAGGREGKARVEKNRKKKKKKKKLACRILGTPEVST